MGMFLALSGVIGKTGADVAASLARYAQQAGGGCEPAQAKVEDSNNCVIEQDGENTTIFYPDDYLEWDASSEFISRDLQTPVFSLHIHDGDLWMYVLYYGGQIIDQFNPIPDYWDDSIADEEIDSWKGNADMIARYVQGLQAADIQNYLVRWNLEAEATKAYPSDEYGQEDWQLLDFMKKLGLPYPDYNEYQGKGQTYKLWTKQLPLT